MDYNLRNYYGKLIFRTRAWKASHNKLYKHGVIKPSDEVIGGSQSYSGGPAFGFALPLFVLWYFDHCGSFVKEGIEGFYSETRPKAYTLTESRTIVWRASLHLGDWPREHGVFGDSTKNIVDLLWGKPSMGCPFERHLVGSTPLEVRPSNITRMYLSSVTNRLLGGRRGVLVGDYMREHAIHVLNNGVLDSETKSAATRRAESVCAFWKEGYEEYIQGKGGKDKKGRDTFLEAERQIIDDIKNKVWPAFMSDVLEKCLVKAGRI